MKRQSLLIIGAGAAGLMAAAKLSLYFDVTILEAGNRIGGRINTKLLQGDVVEGGAEFIHGNLPVTLTLLKEAGIRYVASEGKMYRKQNTHFVQEEEMIEGWDELLQKMKAVKKDMTLEDFLQKYYAGPDQAYFRSQVIGYAEGFDLASPATVSVRYLYTEWSREEEASYRLPGGYAELMLCLQKLAGADGCKLLLNKIVQQVTWKQQYVLIHTTAGEVFESNQLVVTVPPGLLFKNKAATYIQFNPSINAYVKAAAAIGAGGVFKIIIKFKERFWQEDANFFFSKEAYFPTWWTQLPGNIPLLTGWMGGPKVELLSKENNSSILQKALASLGNIFNKPIEEITAGVVYSEIFSWPADETSAGAYSYDTIYSKEARETLNTPLFKTIFFAGEALYKGSHPGTVEAALVSGLEVSEQIKNAIS